MVFLLCISIRANYAHFTNLELGYIIYIYIPRNEFVCGISTNFFEERRELDDQNTILAIAVDYTQLDDLDWVCDGIFGNSPRT